MGLCRSALFPLSSTPILMRWFATRLMSMHNVHLAFMLHCHLLDWSTACTGLLERSRGTLGEPRRTSDSRRHGTVWYCKTNETLLRTRTYLGRDPTGPLAPLGGTESLLHYSGINHLANVFQAYCVFLFDSFCLECSCWIKNLHCIIKNWQHLLQNSGMIT